MSKPSKIRAHNSVLAGKDWCDAMPGGMGARVAMQKQDRWPGPAVADAQNRLWELDHLKLEIIKHEGETGDRRTKFQDTTISSHLKENYQMTAENTAIQLSWQPENDGYIAPSFHRVRSTSLVGGKRLIAD